MFLAFCCSHKVYWLGNLCACALLSSSHCLLTAWGGQWKTHTEDLLWASSHSTAHPSSPLPRPLCQPEARDIQPSPLSWEPDPGPPVHFISRTQLFQNGNFHPSSQTCLPSEVPCCGKWTVRILSLLGHFRLSNPIQYQDQKAPLPSICTVTSKILWAKSSDFGGLLQKPLPNLCLPGKRHQCTCHRACVSFPLA